MAADIASSGGDSVASQDALLIAHSIVVARMGPKSTLNSTSFRQRGITPIGVQFHRSNKEVAWITSFWHWSVWLSARLRNLSYRKTGRWHHHHSHPWRGRALGTIGGQQLGIVSKAAGTYWIASIVGAVVVVFIYSLITRKSDAVRRSILAEITSGLATLNTGEVDYHRHPLQAKLNRFQEKLMIKQPQKAGQTRLFASWGWIILLCFLGDGRLSGNFRTIRWVARAPSERCRPGSRTSEYARSPVAVSVTRAELVEHLANDIAIANSIEREAAIGQRGLLAKRDEWLDDAAVASLAFGSVVRITSAKQCG